MPVGMSGDKYHKLVGVHLAESPGDDVVAKIQVGIFDKVHQGFSSFFKDRPGLFKSFESGIEGFKRRGRFEFAAPVHDVVFDLQVGGGQLRFGSGVGRGLVGHIVGSSQGVFRISDML